MKYQLLCYFCSMRLEPPLLYNGNIYRAFFIFDEGNIVPLFNGFQKKSQKTPSKEIEKGIALKNEYYAGKKRY